MSFGTELQSRSAHEALLAAQDAEIYTLETIKKSITQRIKCDRDYVVALSAIVNGAQKQDTVQSGFQTQTAWVSILSETESLIQMVRDNADKMFQSTLETILNVISEKKALRKTYADERARIDSDLQKFQNTVNNIQTEYKRKLEKLQQSKLKYEEQCKKGKPPQKIGELQSKYVKSVGRVHNIHNDYIVALSEANLYQQHYASVLLPALLEFQQRSQEALVQQCKEALLEYSSLTNCSTDEFQRKHENIRVAVENISPTTEYNAFVLNHRADPVLITPLTFQSNILDNFSETLQPEKIRIDDLTVDFIKQRHKQYSDDLSRSQQQVATKKAEIENVQSELDNSSSTSLPTSLVMLSRKRTLEQLKRELLEVQCVEEKLSSLVQLLDDPLKLLGSDQPPSAIPDISDITPTCDLDGSSSTSRLAAALSNVQLGVTQFKTIARRLGRHHQPTMSSIRHTSISSSDEPNVSFKNGTVGATSNGPKISSTTSSVPVEGYQQFDFMPEQSHQPTFNPGRPLDDEDWYHGVLPREEVQRLLVEDGDYLVRASKNRTTKETQYVLSVMWQTHKHFIVQESEGRFRFEGESFPTVQELIVYQHKSMQPVTRRSEAMLKKPILRADWELRNDDIELHQKIGSGQFGEVFRGTYKITNEEVAVKTCRETLHDDVKRKFLQEGRILKQYDHPNIVRFIGIAAQRPPVMIVMEYVSGGALLNFLRKQGPRQSHKTLINMCKDAASGMAYLEEKNCLHRDLAARNCLVDSDNTVKISDFGMSREEQEYVVSGGLKQIPIKWTAPEALNYGTYTSACDVWSYGVLMWEVFSFGAVPYPGLTNAQARDKVDDGYRMPPPDNTPDQIYQLMMHCWEQEAKKRPHFAEIETQLELIISSIV